MALRLLFLTQTFPRFAGDPAGPFIRDLARGLVRLGHGVTVLVPHARGLPSQWCDEELEVRSFRYAPEAWEVVGYGRSLEADERVRRGTAWVSPLYAMGARHALRRELSRRAYDLVHAHWIIPNGLVATYAGVKEPVAVGLHGSGVFLAEQSRVQPLVRASLRRVRLLTGCSPELVARVQALGFDGPAAVIPYGVDVETFYPEAERRSIWRRRLSIPPTATVLLSVGRMVTKKGFHILVEAIPHILEHDSQAHVVLAGGGDRRRELEAATEAWAPRVHFPGTVERDVLPDLYRAADLFVLPAVHDDQGNVDGLPNVILEAMASGLPVVATNVSGIPLAIDSGAQGTLVPERDPPALARALLRVMADPELRQGMGEAGRRRAVEELTWDAVARRYAAAYEEALGI